MASPSGRGGGDNKLLNPLQLHAQREAENSPVLQLDCERRDPSRFQGNPESFESIRDLSDEATEKLLVVVGPMWAHLPRDTGRENAKSALRSRAPAICV